MRKNILLSLSLVLVLFSSLLYCSATNARPIDLPMQEITTDPYDALWKEVEAFDKKQLPKSAQEVVERIYAKAKKENNLAQIVKATIYKSKYISQLEEDGLVKAINQTREEIESVPYPIKNLLYSVMAEMYVKYMDQQWYKIQNRTQIQGDKTSDIRTWSLDDFSQQCQQLYLASVDNPALKEIDIKQFNAITKGKGAYQLRPNLYDFLAHRALDFFLSERYFLTQPAYTFHIEKEAAFSTANEFINTVFESKDTSSKKLQALHVFQKLTKYHLNDKMPDALIDVTLKRLSFVLNNSIHSDKKSLYLAALNRLAEQYKNHDAAAEVYFYIAKHLQREARQYKGGKDDPHKDDLKKVYAICQKTMDKYPDSFGAKSCDVIIHQLETADFSVRTEAVNPSNQAILASIQYTNTNKIWLRAVLFDEKTEQQFDKIDWEDRITFLYKLRPVRSWTETLPVQDDYRSHSTELSIKNLPYGKYFILVSNTADFTEKSIINYTTTIVSDLAYFGIKSNNDNQNRFAVVDRTTGAPKANVEATFYHQTYNSIRRRYEYNEIYTTYSDKNGFFVYDGRVRDQFKVKLVNETDELFLEDNFYNYNNQPQDYTRQRTHLFLDRAIYRPGQTVYFKGILMTQKNDEAPRIQANKAVTITFHDANHQEVSKLEFISNEFGSVNGHFVVPSGGLLGQMLITSSFGNSNKYFRVEEYKRPKFEVQFNPVKESFRLNDQVTINGTAKAFAGNNIDGATVNYRIVRKAHYPYVPYWMYRWGGYNTSEVEVLSGETETDENGLFEISFAAMPDPTIAKDKKPEFTYTVYADVVDITGETQSTSTTVSVGYVALRVSINTPEQIHTDSLNTIKIATKNLNGEFEKATGQFKIIALLTPSKVYRKRYWKKPDSPMISKADFEKYFPFLPYQDENEAQNWTHGATIIEAAFDSEKSQEMAIEHPLKPGKYLLILGTKDKYGIAVKVEKIITVFELKNSVPSNEFSWTTMLQQSFQPGEQANIWYGSGLDRYVLVHIERKNGIKEKWIKIDGLEQLSYPVTESDRGNFTVTLSSVLQNRAIVVKKRMIVPYTNKELLLEFNTFRDKLLPGAKEQWSVKILGDKKDKVAAEMLATMYDASLDQFASNNWSMSLYADRYGNLNIAAKGFSTSSNQNLQHYADRIAAPYREYRSLNWFGMGFYRSSSRHIRMYDLETTETPAVMSNGAPPPPPSPPPPPAVEEIFKVKKMSVDSAVVFIEEDFSNTGGEANLPKTTDEPIKIRTNLKETVFFFPDLTTDEDGNVIIHFTMNEALTRWKFMGLAHTTDLKVGAMTATVLTQKDLMVVPNPPRFFREGDRIEFTAKVSNLTAKDMNGTAKLELFDAISMQPVDDLLGNAYNDRNFTVKAGQSAPLSWELTIPKGKVMAITHRVTARADNHSDGEESSLPVLTNRMLVTESMPLPVRGKSKKKFTFSRLADNNSSTLQNHKFTLEFTSNPAWYAVQAMPYMMEYPHECTEQIFNRFFANSLGSSLSRQHPKIQRVFEQWKNTDALLSDLSKNQELKSALLAETPWVLEAQSEAVQKKNIGLLFDLNKMNQELDKAFQKIEQRQLSNGGFAWFSGGKDNWYITQYLVEGVGHLKKLGAFDLDSQQSQVLKKAVQYIDDRLVEHYDDLAKQVKKGNAKWEDDHLSQLVIHYLYARSFFKEIEQNKKIQQITVYYLDQAEKYWTAKSIYMQGMLALGLNRYERFSTATQMVASLKERALHHDEMGMYWKYDTGYWWYQLPIETHTLMIEVFDEIAKDTKAVDDLKVWLLKNKQTNRWKTTKATAAAVYVLLNSGDNWLLDDAPVNITLGNSRYDQQIKNAQANAEAGTGYFKTSWHSTAVNKDMARIKVDNPNNVVTWGAAYWQYFEDLDKITSFEETPLKLKKQVFKEVNSDTGPKLEAINAGNSLHPGDKLIVRIELRADRTMEYLHLKDMRASGFEPINVLSRYKWQDGLGYYESTGDVATNFFFSYLPKGTYVFEYPVRVIHKGDFSNGITTIQSMYAPEFTSHSEGIRLGVD